MARDSSRSCSFLRRFAVAMVFVLSACGDSEIDPEEHIRQQLKMLAALAEERDAGGLMSYVSRDYSDNKGLDYRKVNTLLRLRLLRSHDVHVFTRVTAVELRTDDRAEAVVYAGISTTELTGDDSIEDIDVELVRFRLMLTRDDDKWIVDSSHWFRASVDELL